VPSPLASAPSPADTTPTPASASGRPQVEQALAAPPAQRVANPQKFAVTIGPSAIDGQGAFAGEAIPDRAKIGEMRGEFVDNATARQRVREALKASGRVFMVAISDKRSVDATHSTDPLRFANHACAPNMVLKVQQGRVAFYALRDIAPGEELTVRYGTTHHAGRLSCRCGAPQCQGAI
jgi:SET domain-containing protein